MMSKIYGWSEKVENIPLVFGLDTTNQHLWKATSMLGNHKFIFGGIPYPA